MNQVSTKERPTNTQSQPVENGTSNGSGNGSSEPVPAATTPAAVPFNRKQREKEARFTLCNSQLAIPEYDLLALRMIANERFLQVVTLVREIIHEYVGDVVVTDEWLERGLPGRKRNPPEKNSARELHRQKVLSTAPDPDSL